MERGGLARAWVKCRNELSAIQTHATNEVAEPQLLMEAIQVDGFQLGFGAASARPTPHFDRVVVCFAGRAAASRRCAPTSNIRCAA
jgi:hypothetical protein